MGADCGTPQPCASSADPYQPPAEPPIDFLCPISLELMRDPVVTTTGMTYDRGSIEEWWFHCNRQTCPTTQQKVESAFLVPNTYLRQQIEAWVRNNPGHLEEEEDEDHTAGLAWQHDADGLHSVLPEEQLAALVRLASRLMDDDDDEASARLLDDDDEAAGDASSAGGGGGYPQQQQRQQGSIDAAGSRQGGDRWHRHVYRLVTSGAYLRLIEMLSTTGGDAALQGQAGGGAVAEGRRWKALLLLDRVAQSPRAQQLLLAAGYLKCLCELLAAAPRPTATAAASAATAAAAAVTAAASSGGPVSGPGAATDACQQQQQQQQLLPSSSSSSSPSAPSDMDMAHACAALATLAARKANCLRMLRCGATSALYNLLAAQAEEDDAADVIAGHSSPAGGHDAATSAGAKASATVGRGGAAAVVGGAVPRGDDSGAGAGGGEGTAAALLRRAEAQGEGGYRRKARLNALSALVALTKHPEIAAQLGGGSGMRPLLDMLKEAQPRCQGGGGRGGRADVDAQERERLALLEVLTNLAVSEEAKVTLVNIGAVGPLLRALQHSRSTGVQERSAALLTTLAASGDAAQRLVAGPGGGCIGPLAALLSGGKGAAVGATRRTASNLLFLLVLSNGSQGGRSRTGCGSTWWGSVRRHTAAQAIIDGGGLAPLVALVGGEDEEAREHGVLLLKLLACSKSLVNKEKFAEAGAIAPLVQLLGSESASCRDHAARALAGLSTDTKARVAALRAGAARQLRLMAQRHPDLRKVANATLGMMAGHDDDVIDSSCFKPGYGHYRAPLRSVL